MIYEEIDAHTGRLDGKVVWRYYFRKGTTCESKVMKLKPVRGVIDLTFDRKLRFFPLNEYGERTPKGVNFSYISRFADTYEEAVADYNRIVDEYIKEFSDAADKIKKDFI